MSDQLRETYDFTTTNGVVVKIKKDITGREKRAIDLILFSANEFQLKENQDFKLNGSVLQQYNEEAVKQLVVAVNNETQNVLEKILDLSALDYQEIFEEVQRKYQDLSSFLKKKNG